MKLVLILGLGFLMGCASAEFYDKEGNLIESAKFYGVGSAKSSNGSEIVSELGLPDYIGR